MEISKNYFLIQLEIMFREEIIKQINFHLMIHIVLDELALLK